MTFRNMANAALGIQSFVLGNVDTVAQHPIGTVVRAWDPTQGYAEFIYLPGAANVTTGTAVIFDLTPGAQAVAITDSDLHANTGYPVAVAVCAIAAASYGWYQVYGVAKTKGIAAGAAGKCFLTADNATGAFDDTAIAGAQVLGARQLTAVDTPAAGFAYTFLSYPHIQGQDAT